MRADDSEKTGFWSFQKILLVIVFAAGLLIGGYATHVLIEPMFNGSFSSDTNSLILENTRLDARADEMYNCLLVNNIDPESCMPV